MSNFRPTTPTSGITQSELFAKSDRRVVKDTVVELIRVIDQQIQTAHASGFNKVACELPVNFNLNNMSKADAQTMVYSELVMLYRQDEPKGKGFENTYIEIGPKSILHISWVNGMDDEEKNMRNAVIKQCLHRK